ncbi:MAG: extracellular solute-binding protein [Acetobacteraceae bacterium]|nr:extracellular solute-binding protein [Acetobacteraceae bacterium]
MFNLTRRASLHLALGGAAALTAAPAHAAGSDQLIEKARKEGVVNSVGMPDDWANWAATWKHITDKYGLRHADTDMSSAEELAKFAAEKSNASADIGDVGFDFCRVAVQRDLAAAYKPTTFADVPSWAKDADGRWMLAYTGTIAFVVAKDIPNPPKSWADLLTGTYKIAAGDVGKASQSNAAVLACAIALGGDQTHIDPAMEFFAKLAKQKRLLTITALPATMGRGEVQVGLLWDFNALSYRDKVGGDRFSVVIPADGSVTSGYSTIINKYAKNPNAAMLTREFIFSDQGQINLADGYARPIRFDHITLPAPTKAKMLPPEQYAKARPINPENWAEGARKVPAMWQEKVLSEM